MYLPHSKLHLPNFQNSDLLVLEAGFPFCFWREKPKTGRIPLTSTGRTLGGQQTSTRYKQSCFLNELPGQWTHPRWEIKQSRTLSVFTRFIVLPWHCPGLTASHDSHAPCSRLLSQLAHLWALSMAQRMAVALQHNVPELGSVSASAGVARLFLRFARRLSFASGLSLCGVLLS